MWILLACSGPDAPTPDDGDEVEQLPDVSDSAEPDDTDDTGHDGDDDDGACAPLYDPDAVQIFEVTIEEDDWEALERDYRRGDKEYHPARFRLGEEEVDAAIRLKGNPSFSWFTEKMQFVVRFNEEDPDARFQGLRAVSLDASWYEPTLLRDRVAWSVMGGFPDTLFGACVNHARLVVNGSDYGFYTSIEYFDREWLERTMGPENADNTLWKYGSDPVTNEHNADYGELEDLWSARTVDELRALGEVEQWLDVFAAEAVLGDDDGYWCCEHNFYVYDHPTRGLLFVPWDFDDIFDVAPYTSDPITGYGRDGLFQSQVFVTLMGDPTLAALYLDRVEALNQALGDPAVIADLDAWDAQIAADALADPTRSWGDTEREQTVAATRAWITQRAAFVDAWLACERGQPVDADGDGADSCADPDDDDATRFPGAAEACNDLDDDGDGIVDEAAACADCRRHDVDDVHLLFCNAPRSHDDAEANCVANGGDLATIDETVEWYLTWFYTWPADEEWWTGGSATGSCPTWDEGTGGNGYESCSAELRSICALP